MAESCVQSFKRVNIRQHICATRSDAHAKVFDPIEMSYNPKRRHDTSTDTSPVEFERRHA